MKKKRLCKQALAVVCVLCMSLTMFPSLTALAQTSDPGVELTDESLLWRPGTEGGQPGQEDRPVDGQESADEDIAREPVTLTAPSELWQPGREDGNLVADEESPDSSQAEATAQDKVTLTAPSDLWKPKPQAEEPLVLEKGDLTLTALKTAKLVAADIPEVVPNEAIAENQHVNRLREQEDNLNSVKFQNRDGTKTMYYYSTPVKYKDKNGQIKDKSNQIVETGDGYGNADNDIRTYFPKKLNQNKGVKLAYGTYTIELSPAIKGNSGASRQTGHNKNGDPSEYVQYPNVFGKDTAVRYTPTFEGFKEDVILNRYTGQNEFTFRLRTDGLRLVCNEEGVYKLVEPLTGRAVAQIGELIVHDSQEGEIPSPGEYIHQYQVETVAADKEYRITMAVDEDYLTDPQRVYPVYVDPTVTADIYVSGSGTSKTIQDTAIYSGEPNIAHGNYNYQWAIVGYNGGTYGTGRMLMKFPGLSSDPTYKSLSASEITSLKLNMYEGSGYTGTAIMDFYQYTGRAWTEAGAKCSNIDWDNYQGGNNFTWKGIGDSGWKEFDLTKMVGTWKSSSTALDKGIMIKNYTSESNSKLSKHFYTSDAAGYRPYLSFTYSKAVAVTGVRLSKSSFTLNVDDSLYLSSYVNVLPSDASYKSVSYTSSKDSVASVTSSGFVCAKSVGTTTITVRSIENSSYYATCTIKVENPVEQVKLTRTSFTMNVNSSLSLSSYVSVQPADATNKSVSYTSSKPSVATVSSSGKISAATAGTTTITVRSIADTSKYATCTVKVVVPVSQICIGFSSMTMRPNTTANLGVNITIVPSNATDKSVTYTSSNFSVATITSSGLVCAKSVGTTTITVRSKSNSNVYATCTIFVRIPATSVKFTQTSFSIAVNDTLYLNKYVTVSPTDATNKNVTYTSSNESVVSVTSSGMVCAKSEGKTTIKVKLINDSTIYATCTVEVGPPLTGADTYINDSNTRNLLLKYKLIDANIQKAYNQGSITYTQKQDQQKKILYAMDLARADYVVVNPQSNFVYQYFQNRNYKMGDMSPLPQSSYTYPNNGNYNRLAVMIIQRALEALSYLEPENEYVYGTYDDQTHEAVLSSPYYILGSNDFQKGSYYDMMGSNTASERTAANISNLNKMRIIHNEVARRVALKVGGRTTQTTIYKKEDHSRWGFADVMKTGTTNEYIWEVKPWWENYRDFNSRAMRQLNGYITAWNSVPQNYTPHKSAIQGYSVGKFAFNSIAFPDQIVVVESNYAPATDVRSGLVHYRPVSRAEYEKEFKTDFVLEAEPVPVLEPTYSYSFSSALSLGDVQITQIAEVGGKIVIVLVIGAIIFYCAPELLAAFALA